MKERLESINSLCWGLEQAMAATGLGRAATRVYLSREKRRGNILSGRRNLYVLNSRYKNFQEDDFFRVANWCQTPSYVSLLSALSFHGVSSQMPQGAIESVSPVRPRKYRLRDTVLKYFYIKPSRYFGFRKQSGFFVATPEKALLDALYLQKIGRYRLDAYALNWTRLSEKEWKRCLGKYPKAFQRYAKTWRKTHGHLREA